MLTSSFIRSFAKTNPHNLWSSSVFGVRMSSDNQGRGGYGGSIREAGGAFGEMEHAREEEYFRRQSAKQLDDLKQHYDEEIKHHEDTVRKGKEAIERLREKKKKAYDEAEKQKTSG